MVLITGFTNFHNSQVTFRQKASYLVVTADNALDNPVAVICPNELIM